MRDTPGGPAPVAWPGRRSVLTLALGMSVGLPLARLAGAEDADLPPGAAPLIERPCRRFSQFDLTAVARVLNGPAPRRLPALSVKVANGFPVVAGAFIGRPGFGPGGG